MTFPIASPIAGATQYSFTSPTYTITADTPPANNGKQWAVTAIGGTQAGVNLHSVAAPFTLSVFRPVNFKTLAPVNAVTGVLKSVPMNSYKVITRKGLLPLAGQAFKTGFITTTIDVPAGADLADPANIKAMLSMHIGALNQIPADIGSTALNGVL